VTADCDYGDNPNFLAGLEERGERYAVAVRADFAVATGRGAGAPPHRADALLGDLPAGVWRSVRWREGSKGWLRGRFAAVRCWRVTADGTRRVGWLVGEREARGQDERRRFYWSNLGPQVPLDVMAGYAHRRHWVEQFYEEAKTLLGWDQYQGRLWAGFHRHAVTVMLAYSFLVWQEWRLRWARPRPGRARPAFSPSAGPSSSAAAGGPPAARRLATVGSYP
jgi:SRSO17 transposase